MSFTQISNKIIDSVNLTGEEKALLIILMRFNPSYPSYYRIMAATGWRRSKISKILKQLNALNIIDWTYKRGSSNCYKIRPEKDWILVLFSRENKENLINKTRKKRVNKVVLKSDQLKKEVVSKSDSEVVSKSDSEVVSKSDSNNTNLNKTNFNNSLTVNGSFAFNGISKQNKNQISEERVKEIFSKKFDDELKEFANKVKPTSEKKPLVITNENDLVAYEISQMSKK